MVLETDILKELRKRYNKSRDFFIRIREDSNDIVYYNGIKAFEITEKRNKIEFDIPENVYCLRYGGIESCVSDGEDKRESIEHLVDDTIKLREDMSDYFNISIKEVKLKMGTSYYRDTKYSKYIDVQENVCKILSNINEELSKFDLEINVEEIIDKIKTSYEKKVDKYIFEHSEIEKYINSDADVFEKIKEIKKRNKNYSVDVSIPVFDGTLYDKKLSIEENLELEKIFILNTIYNDDLKYSPYTGFKFPYFNYKKDIDIDYNHLDYFDEKVKIAIEKYQKSVRGEDEKKYQHLFMLSDKIPTKFKDPIKGLEPFEEEYYTKEGKTGSTKDDDKGRIDCIFVKNDTKEIFLIELKVDEKVVGNPDVKEHGVNEHLEDIKDMLNEKKEEFLEVLIDRYNYRYKSLDEDKTLDKESSYKIHFWTIIAYTNENSREAIIEKLNNLKKKCKDKDLQNLLDSTKEITRLKKYPECDIRILFDKWDKEKISDEKFITLSEFYDNY